MKDTHTTNHLNDSIGDLIAQMKAEREDQQLATATLGAPDEQHNFIRVRCPECDGRGYDVHAVGADREDCQLCGGLGLVAEILDGEDDMEMARR